MTGRDSNGPRSDSTKGATRSLATLGVTLALFTASLFAAEPAPVTKPAAPKAAPATKPEPKPAAEPAAKPEPKPAAEPKEKGEDKTDPVPLNKAGTVLLDKAKSRILLKGQVCLREGFLELFSCLKQTKEHEAIVSVDTKAYVVHTGLLALGAKTGAPAKFEPKFESPTGQKVEIFVNWTDAEGKAQRVAAQEWIRLGTRKYFVEPLEKLPEGVKLPAGSDLRYDAKLKEMIWYGHMTDAQRDEFLKLSKDPGFRKTVQTFFDKTQFQQMQAHFVFAGSGFYVEEDTGKKHYLAEDGDLISVSNFASSMIDIDTQSSAGNDGLLFEAWTERIPERGTAVTIEIIPVPEPEKKPAESK